MYIHGINTLSKLKILMMKKMNLFVALVGATFMLASCGGNEMKKEAVKETVVEETVESTSMAIKLEESNVMWKGSVLGMHSHFGNIALTGGSLEMQGDDIVGGEFEVDMTSINPQDSAYSEENTPEMLVGHLSSGDFFLVDSFPTAKFVIKSYDKAANTLTGDLTVRGITNSETVEGVMIDSETNSAKGSLVFNRQDYDVAFTHPMKDVVLSDDIELTIELKM